MKYSALLLALAAVGIVIPACRQEPADRHLQPQVSRKSPENGNPGIDRGSQSGDDSHRGGKAQPGDVAQQPHDPEAADGPQPGDAPGTNPQAGNDEEPPLLLDDEPPLLLDDQGQESPEATGPVADNTRCHHCHLDYVAEELVVAHARANIGCADCHGNCDEHIADESWASGGNGTPPEIMYPREKINPFCLGCHPKDKIDPLKHKPFFAGAAKEKYCTDCHGDHRLPVRKCKWR